MMVPEMASLMQVPIAPLPLGRFREVLDDDSYEGLLTLAERAAKLLEGRVVWCVNSTAHGGGVAEMLRSLLAYTRGAGVNTRWVVMSGTPAFFTLTKRLHNCLHAAPGAIAPGSEDRAAYEAVTAAAAAELAPVVRPGDVVILHDPQTAGLAPALRDTGAALVWRAHIGVDDADGETRRAWDFLRPYLTDVGAYVFSRAGYAWDGLDAARTVVIPPSIDAFSAKNQELAASQVTAILAAIGLLDGAADDATFAREDGTPGRVDRRAEIIQEAPLGPADRVVTQVSRWDRLKDPIGVLEGFVAEGDGCPTNAHLVLAGPAVSGVADDPEGPEVLAEVTAAWRALPQADRARVHIACLPMDDAEENAAMVNALQRYASVVVQKSLAEGFGLTVAEAMWKARPLVVSGVGGIRDQVTDGVTGLVVAPTDLAAFGDAVGRLLTDEQLAARLAGAARERVEQQYLEPRHLGQWIELIEHVLTQRAPASVRVS
jgi:trehalose synthase